MYLKLFTHNFSLLTGVKSAHVAQSAEHILGKDEVTGSIPVMGSSKAPSREQRAIRNDMKKYFKADGPETQLLSVLC